MCENHESFFAPCQCMTSGRMVMTVPGFRLTAGFPFLLVPALAGCADEDLSAAFSCVVDVPVASAARFKGYVGQK